MFMRQQGKTTVTGGIRGNNNRVFTNNVHIRNVTNNNGEGNRDSKGGGDDALAILVSLAVVAIAAAYLYLHHYDQIFFWLKIGLAIAGGVHFAALVPQYRAPDVDWGALLFTGFGMALVIAQMFVTTTIEGALPADVFRIVAQPTLATGFLPAALEVWDRFNDLGHRLIMENLSAFALLASGLFLNILYGIKCLSEGFAWSDESAIFDWLSDVLDSMKIAGSLVSALFTLGSFYLISGGLMPGGG